MVKSILEYIGLSLLRIPTFLVSLFMTPIAYVLWPYSKSDILWYWRTEINPPEWFTRALGVPEYNELSGFKKFWIYYRWTALRNYGWNLYMKYYKVPIKGPFDNTKVYRSRTDYPIPGFYMPQLRMLDNNLEYSVSKGNYINWWYYYEDPDIDFDKVTIPGYKILMFRDLNDKPRFLYACIKRFPIRKWMLTLELRFGWNPYDGLHTWHSRLHFSYGEKFWHFETN